MVQIDQDGIRWRASVFGFAIIYGDECSDVDVHGVHAKQIMTEVLCYRWERYRVCKEGGADLWTNERVQRMWMKCLDAPDDDEEVNGRQLRDNSNTIRKCTCIDRWEPCRVCKNNEDLLRYLSVYYSVANRQCTFTH